MKYRQPRFFTGHRVHGDGNTKPLNLWHESINSKKQEQEILQRNVDALKCF